MMSDLRYDPITAVWVAIAQKRRERPIEFIPIEQVHHQIICPFCAGNEEETPPPIAALHAGGQELTSSDDIDSWISRVIPNKYPSLTQAGGTRECGPYSSSAVDGIQELVIPTPRHVTSISELTADEMDISFLACQRRISVLRSMPQIKHVVLFMNCRSSAGASLEHIHFQIMGSPVLSRYLEERNARNENHVKSHGESLVTALMKWEMSQEVRVLRETSNFVMYCPFASRFSFQVCVVPKDPDIRFETEDQAIRSELADLCLSYITKLEQILENPAYNLIVNLAPNQYRKNEHWFVDIFPRLNHMAGFEIGTDISVNPVPPETAARQLRTN